ncbi:hypothetical protein HKD37_20G056365 [Glycine soja]
MADVEPSAASLDRLEAVMAKLVAAQASMDSKLDVILLKLNTMVPIQLSPSSSSPKSPPLAGTMLPLLPKVTSQLFPSSSFAKPPPPAETTLPPLPMVASHLPINAKHHAPSSDPLRAASHRFLTEPPSRCILSSNLCFSLFVVFSATVRETNLHHPFLLTVYTTLVAAKWLCPRYDLHSLIPTPTFIWDPGSIFLHPTP